MFDIKLGDSIRFDPNDDDGGLGFPGVFGLIEIGNFRERFIASTFIWTPRDYYSQWIEALERLTISKQPKSALIQSFFGLPGQASYLRWWNLYKLGKDVHVQEQLLFYEQQAVRFDMANPYIHVSDYRSESENDDRYKYADYSMPIDWIGDALERLRLRSN